MSELAELREAVAQLKNALTLVVHAVGGTVTVTHDDVMTLPPGRVVVARTPDRGFTLTLEEDR